MTKLVAPLLSLDAHGTLGGALTYSKRSSGPQVRFQKKQRGLATSAQTIQRAFFQTAVGWWHELTPTEQEEWRTEGNNP